MTLDLTNIRLMAAFLSKTEVNFDLVSAVDELAAQIRCCSLRCYAAPCCLVCCCRACGPYPACWGLLLWWWCLLVSKVFTAAPLPGSEAHGDSHPAPACAGWSSTFGGKPASWTQWPASSRLGPTWAMQRSMIAGCAWGVCGECRREGMLCLFVPGPRCGGPDVGAPVLSAIACDAPPICRHCPRPHPTPLPTLPSALTPAEAKPPHRGAAQRPRHGHRPPAGHELPGRGDRHPPGAPHTAVRRGVGGEVGVQVVLGPAAHNSAVLVALVVGAVWWGVGGCRARPSPAWRRYAAVLSPPTPCPPTQPV